MMKRGFLTLGLGLMTARWLVWPMPLKRVTLLLTFPFRQSTRTNRPLRWLICRVKPFTLTFGRPGALRA